MTDVQQFDTNRWTDKLTLFVGKEGTTFIGLSCFNNSSCRLKSYFYQIDRLAEECVRENLACRLAQNPWLSPRPVQLLLKRMNGFVKCKNIELLIFFTTCDLFLFVFYCNIDADSKFWNICCKYFRPPALLKHSPLVYMDKNWLKLDQVYCAWLIKWVKRKKSSWLKIEKNSSFFSGRFPWVTQLICENQTQLDLKYQKLLWVGVSEFPQSGGTLKLQTLTLMIQVWVLFWLRARLGFQKHAQVRTPKNHIILTLDFRILTAQYFIPSSC